MKDMGLADVILDIQIKRSSEGLILTQSHYVDKILGKFSKDDSGITRTPMNTNQHLSKNKCESVDQVEYARVISSLMYLMSYTRSDIAFIVSSLNKFTSNLGKTTEKVLRYLKYTRNYKLHYSRDPTILEGFSDASWISDIQDVNGTMGEAIIEILKTNDYNQIHN
ncbi:Zinc finger, CCHC-type [Gossypium australe]|uniref:Zinc finger, CCHC-type n=1 Tax=Gossypium australe TaxID=47621 RepID=A0A5B6WSY3_9ROSI|nr:Zinc finger, CCHC-type [Gossypium australe]